MQNPYTCLLPSQLEEYLQRWPDEADAADYDARYVVHAGADEQYIVSAESLDLAWRDIAVIAGDADARDNAGTYDPALRRMARKWLQRTGAPGAQ